MKEIMNIGNGAIVISEEGGTFTMAVNDQVALGGGSANGIVSLKGSGTCVVKGKLAFDLAMAVLKAHSPAALVPIESGVQAIADAAIDSL